MKKVHVYIFLLIIGLDYVVSIDCMFAAVRNRAMNWRTAGGIAHSSMLSGRGTSWLQNFKSRVSTYNPFHWGQRSYFSTTPFQHISSKLDTFLFEGKMLTRTEILKEINSSIVGHTEGKDRMDQRIVFNDRDLEQAKHKLGNLIEKNPGFKDAIIEESPYSPRVFRQSRSEGYKFTLLDIVLCYVFSLDAEGQLVFTRILPSENTINIIQLLKYLISKGARINPENYQLYRHAYFSLLMGSYKSLYVDSNEEQDRIHNAIEMFKTLFMEFDPLIGEMIPDFKERLREAQKERAEIEANPDAYKEKVAEEKNRHEYIQIKAQKMADEENKKKTWPRDYISWHHVADQIKFDEKEYREWLNSGKNKDFFYTDKKRAEKNNFKQQKSKDKDKEQDNKTKSVKEVETPKEKLTKELNISPIASDQEIKSALTSYRKLHHPDRTPHDLSPQKRKEEIIRRNASLANINDLFDKYEKEKKRQQLVTE